MLEALTSLFQRLGSAAGDPVAVVVELVLIGLAINWAAGMLEGTRGTRPLRRLLLVLLIVTLGARIMTVQFGWARLGVLYNYFVVAVAFIGLVAFQPELRRAFMRVGDVGLIRRTSSKARLIAALVKSAGYLSRNKYGAVIAIRRGVDLRGWAENGTLINAEVSANLLNAIFFPNSPLHDLGVIIQDNRVVAANCQFPSAESDEVDASVGSRHLAAIGMSYETDALLLVVSEETGTISIAEHGKLTRYLSLDDLEHELETRLAGETKSNSAKRRVQKGSASQSWYLIRRVLVVVPLTLAIWYLADQEIQVDSENIRFTLQPEPPLNVDVQILAPDPPVLTAKLRGPKRALDRLLHRGGDGDRILEWQVAGVSPGEFRPETRDILQNQVAAIRSLGLTVREADPPQLSVLVDDLITRTVAVGVDRGDALLEEVRAEPTEVRVTLPSRAWERVADPDQLVVARVGQRVADLPPGDHQLSSVPLQLRLDNLGSATLQPRVADVQLRVLAQQAREFSVEKVSVRLSFSPSFWQLYSRSNYQLVRSDPLEWLLKELRLRSDNADVSSLTADDVDAYVLITPDLLNTIGVDVVRDVQFHLPAGVSVVGPPREVRVRLVEPKPGEP